MSRIALALAPLLALFAGCGGPTPPALYPVSGTVASADGNAVTAGGLIFIPESGDWGGRVINASVNADGSFEATTSTSAGGKTDLKPGVPAGRYKVIYHPPGDGQKVGLERELPDVITVEGGTNLLQLVLPVKPADANRNQ